MTLLLTDVIMPEMTGRQLADQALRRLPGLRVLFTTGHTRDAVIRNGMLAAGAAVLTSHSVSTSLPKGCGRSCMQPRPGRPSRWR